MEKNIFQKVKELVPIREAAEKYGLTVNSRGLSPCPFHPDKTPSLKYYDDSFYCFGCQAAGDVISLVARLDGTGNFEAAKKLAADFGIDIGKGSYAGEYLRDPGQDLMKKYKQAEDAFFRTYSAYYRKLREWLEKYSPKDPEEKPDPKFSLAANQITPIGEFLEQYIHMTDEEKIKAIEDRRKEYREIGTLISKEQQGKE